MSSHKRVIPVGQVDRISKDVQCLVLRKPVAYRTFNTVYGYAIMCGFILYISIADGFCEDVFVVLEWFHTQGSCVAYHGHITLQNNLAICIAP